MGNPFKKAYKAVTKPISKVLDKLVPNEIKPFLPYMAAFAPYMMGPGAGGIFSGMGINNKMLQRALMSGTLNLGSQLAQEGSEGEFSGLSLGLAGLQGALTAPGAADKLTGMTTQGGLDAAGTVGRQADQIMQGRNLLTRATDTGLAGLSKGAEFLGKGVDILGPGGTEPGLNLATLEAAALPISQGTGDLALADAQLALRDYENEMANQDQLSLIDDAGRRRAIRAAMEAAGHLEEIIVDTLAELGLKQGGIVGLKKGGRIGYRYGDKVAQTAASEDAPFHQQRVLKEDLDTSGGVESIWGGQSELEEAKSKVRDIDKRSNIVDFEMDLTKRLIEEYDLDWRTADKYASIINFYANYNPLGLSNKEKILERGYTGNDEIILKELENMSNLQSFAHGGVASVLPKGREADYRGGGVIPVGSRERADDVPARLSKNEFVMTADAVRAAGGGNINKGAKRMYNLMNNLEARV